MTARSRAGSKDRQSKMDGRRGLDRDLFASAWWFLLIPRENCKVGLIEPMGPIGPVSPIPDAPRRWYILGQRIVQLDYDPSGGQCKVEFGSGQPDDRNSGTLYFYAVLTLTRSFDHSILSAPVSAQP